jgi:hypothetical protein
MAERVEMPTEEDIQEIADECGDTLIEQVQTLAKRKGVEVSADRLKILRTAIVTIVKTDLFQHLANHGGSHGKNIRLDRGA